ncbi:MAG: DUF3306 domain-containing protein [Rhodospirillales bacterium]
MTIDQDEENGFLNRWSQRKAAIREEELDKKTDIPDAQEAALPADGNAENDEEEINPEDLPKIDTLDKDSDYTIFMKKGVPEELKRLALRKLFHSDPALAVLDGLNDYDEDYSMIGMVVEEVTTRYKVGKGMVDPDDEKLADEEDVAEIEDIKDVEELPEEGEEEGEEQLAENTQQETLESDEEKPDEVQPELIENPQK